MARGRALISWVFVLIIAGVLAYAGLLKINDPTPTSDFVVEVFSIRATNLVRAFGFVETAIAIWLVSGAARRVVALIAGVFFVAFAVIHGFASTGPVEATCGCLGKNEWVTQWPDWAWIAFNVVLAFLAAMLTVSSGHHGLGIQERPAETSE
jgi:uncharacterized membrane protein YphA (DoxX/SURF4 family)